MALPGPLKHIPLRLKRTLRHLSKRFLPEIFLNRTVQVGQQRLRVSRIFPNPFASTFGAQTGEFEPWLHDLCAAALRAAPGAFIDVGANLGQTLKTVLSVAPECLYLGFEPHVAACHSVEDFIQANSLSNCHILPIALSEKRQISEMFLSRRDKGASVCPAASLIHDFRPASSYDSTKYTVTLAGDEVVAAMGIDAISVIKIDVEGGELEVIRGFEKTLSTIRPFLIFEVLNFNLYRDPADADTIDGRDLDEQTVRFRTARTRTMEDLLSRLSYRLFQIQPEGLQEITQIKPTTRPTLEDVNYLAVPAGRRDAFFQALTRRAGTRSLP